ncbi:hypothetical protein C8R43DRAFT_237084 [Mycena crocata]|nr:hypothetical protein C8R43DRAFT_237084 [Mycena crocata]
MAETVESRITTVQGISEARPNFSLVHLTLDFSSHLPHFSISGWHADFFFDSAHAALRHCRHQNCLRSDLSSRTAIRTAKNIFQDTASRFHTHPPFIQFSGDRFDSFSSSHDSLLLFGAFSRVLLLAVIVGPSLESSRAIARSIHQPVPEYSSFLSDARAPARVAVCGVERRLYVSSIVYMLRLASAPRSAHDQTRLNGEARFSRATRCKLR